MPYCNYQESSFSSYILCYVDRLPHPVTLQTAYADTRHSQEVKTLDRTVWRVTILPTPIWLLNIFVSTILPRSVRQHI